MNPETIGKNIRDARRQKEMTQAVLAERMNVSESAISQWESGKTSPDLSLIPDLCGILGISADWLLSVNAEQRAKEIEAILKRVNDLDRNGRGKETLPILEEACLRYPEDHRLARALMYATEDPDRQIAIGERLLAECTEEEYRTTAIQILIYAYKEKGNLRRAEELARQMPALWTTSDVFLTHIAEGEEYQKQARYLRFGLLNILVEAIHYGTYFKSEDSFSEDEKAKVFEKGIALLSLFFEKGDYGFFHGSLRDEYRRLAEWHARRGETNDALGCLENAVYHAMKFIEYVEEEPGSYHHTSLLFRGMTGGGNVGVGSDQNSASDLLEEMKEPAFDSLRESPAFREIEAKLEAAAGPWNVAGNDD
ncbi:MAG: helix-turn-helix transcriptional regulator [Ruminococcaceae bacterium]|nr:helix-turn-helix transcriptional regulator [Oscillospiraceae bacterium]